MGWCQGGYYKFCVQRLNYTSCAEKCCIKEDGCPKQALLCAVLMMLFLLMHRVEGRIQIQKKTF